MIVKCMNNGLYMSDLGLVPSPAWWTRQPQKDTQSQ
jgi:hypothetical protein